MLFLQAAETTAAAEAAVTTANVQERFPELVPGIISDLPAFLPEIILSVGVCWVILADLFRKKETSKNLAFHTFVFIGLALFAVMARGFGRESSTLFRGMVVDDGFGAFFKVFILIGTAICIPMITMDRGFAGKRMGEFYGLLLGAVVGMFLMVSAKNLLMFFIGIEFASYTSYLITGYLKDDRRASEGALKYVIYGSVASGAMVYGLSILYGLTGSLDVSALAETLLVSQTTDLTVVAAIVLSFAGFAYKMAAFPMHFWSPDVYEGVPVPFTAFLSVVSKAAGFAVFMRFVWAFTAGGSYSLDLVSGAQVHVNWPVLIGIVAALTMTVGNLAALFQSNLKRLLAYSSIAHAGYLLMGVAAIFPTGHARPGWEAVLYYLLVYLFMNLGAFLIVAIYARHTGRETVESYRGLGVREPVLAVAMCIFLVSLIGLPPTGGFAGKLQLLEVVLQSDMIALAIIAVLNTVVSVYYYARIIKVMFLEKGSDTSRLEIGGAMRGFVVAMMIPIFYLGIFWDATLDVIRGLEFTLR